MNKLKIGVLLDDTEIGKYLLDLLVWAERQDGLEVAALLVQDGPAQPRPVRPISALLFGIVLAVERLLIRLFRAHRNHLAAYRLADAAPAARLVKPAASPQQAPALDLLVYCGAGTPAAELAGMARLGIVALDYHGQRASRAAPPGFWEAYGKASKTEFEIRHLAPGGGASRVVAAGSFRTKFFFMLNQAHLYSKGLAQLKGLLKTIAATRCLPPDDRARPYSGPYRGAPRWHQSAAYLGKLAGRFAAKAFCRVFNFQEKWGISCVYANWQNAALWRSTRIAAPRGHFWADPFLCTHDGSTYCFVEDFVYKTKRAHISVLEITDQGARLLGPCIREPFHMSFPFLFRHLGELYMCPESSAARQIRIYRCKAFPLEWELCWVAMDDISAADSMFFEHGGRWWMLTNLDRSGLEDHCAELHLFHASSPFDPNWIAHPQNPLRVDPEGGRNAGLILDDGRIIRAAQRQGFDRYGAGLSLYEIVELNEERYVERLVSELDCNFRDGLIGSHHMSTTGRITVVDHLDRCFFP